MHRRDRVFGLLAVLAVVIYMLACGSRPTWSPDSNRVVFSFADRESETFGLALYNLQTAQTERIFEADEEMFFQPVWLGQKEQIIALAVSDEDVLDIIQIDLATGQDKLIKTMPSKDAQIALMVPPALADERYLFFSCNTNNQNSELVLYRLDLETAKLRLVPDSTDLHLFQTGEGYLYLRGRDDRVEVGSVDVKKLRFRKLLTLKDEKVFGGMGPALLRKKDGSEFVFITEEEHPEQGKPATKKKDLKVLRVNRRGKLVKTIPLTTASDAQAIVHMVYAPDERTLFVPTLSAVDPKKDANGGEKERVMLSLFEVDIERGSSRQVLEVYVDKDEEQLMQPSISPDGKYLAVNILLPKDQKSSLLYLVDLTTPQRKVTKVPLPAKPEPVAAPQTQ